MSTTLAWWPVILAADDLTFFTPAASSMTSHTLLLADGRTLGYAIYGCRESSSSRATLIYFHGCPSSRLEGAYFDAHCAALGIRLVSFDRPGLGLSSPTSAASHSKRAIVPDVMALTAHLGLEQYFLLAYSGGAPYAFTCARFLPSHQVLGAGAIAGLAPYSIAKRHMPFVQRILANTVYYLPSIAEWAMDIGVGNAARSTSLEAFEGIMEQAISGLDERSRAVFRCKGGLNTGAFKDTMREAYSQSTGAVVRDAQLLVSELDFELHELAYLGQAIHLSYGSEDENVPLGSGEDVAGHLAGAARFTGYCEATHFTIIPEHGLEILSQLVRQ